MQNDKIRKYAGLRHSCPKSILKKEGKVGRKVSTKNEETKKEIEFWVASY